MASGDSIKQGNTMEYWIRDSLATIEFNEQQVADMAQILNPLRIQIEEALGLFDPTKDKWRHFRVAIWTAIPAAYEKRVTKLIERWMRNNQVIDPYGRKNLT